MSSTAEYLEELKQKVEIYTTLLQAEVELMNAKQSGDKEAVKRIKPIVAQLREESNKNYIPSVTIIPATIRSTARAQSNGL